MNTDRLLEQLWGLGVRAGDTLMVHASLRRLGIARSQGVEDGASLLLDALDAAVGSEGTLVMILGTDSPHEAVNQRPIEERAAFLAGVEPFAYLTAPVLPEVGWLAEAFRRRPGTIVSHNPSGRFGARGRLAHALLDGQPWNDYYGPGSPLERLCQHGGRVLRLGANPDTVTVLHYAEYLAQLPNKRRTRWDYLITSEEGPRHVWTECLNDNEGIAHYDGDDYFASITEAYLALGRHAAGQVGEARGELIEAADLVTFGARWMEEHLRP